MASLHRSCLSTIQQPDDVSASPRDPAVPGVSPVDAKPSFAVHADSDTITQAQERRRSLRTSRKCTWKILAANGGISNGVAVRSFNADHPHPQKKEHSSEDPDAA